LFSKFKVTIEPKEPKFNANLTIDEILNKGLYKKESMQQQIAHHLGVKLPELNSKYSS